MLIKEIRISKEDIEALKEIDSMGVTPSKLGSLSLDNICVCKPWGYEYKAYESEDNRICAWVLHMLCNGTGTSIHCHRTKITLIHVLKGKIWVKTLHETFNLSEGDEMWIDRATFHAMGALEDGTVLTEIESPSFKPDAIRYKDTWGRERQEYESKCELVDSKKMHCPYLSYQVFNKRIILLVNRARTEWNL